MKAVVYEKFGPPEVLKLKNVPKPAPKKNEVLVRILASTVSIEDPRMRSAEFDWPLILRIIGGFILGFNKPKKQILGIEFAGKIEQVGQNVLRLKKGDHIYGYTGVGLGAHAQFKCMPEKGIMALKPTNMTFAESATIPNGALTSLVFLRNKGRIKKGEHVLINGASGAVGTAAVQLAKYYGAKVTGVCSATNLELVRSIGADSVINYEIEDFTKNGQHYDIIFDTVGKRTFAQCKASLKIDGRYLRTIFGLSEMLQMMWTSVIGGKRVIIAASNFDWKVKDLLFLKEIIEKRRLKAVIDRIYSMEQIAEAHCYVEKGHKKGNVVINMEK